MSDCDGTVDAKNLSKNSQETYNKFSSLVKNVLYRFHGNILDELSQEKLCKMRHGDANSDLKIVNNVRRSAEMLLFNHVRKHIKDSKASNVVMLRNTMIGLVETMARDDINRQDFNSLLSESERGLLEVIVKSSRETVRNGLENNDFVGRAKKAEEKKRNKSLEKFSPSNEEEEEDAEAEVGKLTKKKKGKSDKETSRAPDASLLPRQSDILNDTRENDDRVTYEDNKDDRVNTRDIHHDIYTQTDTHNLIDNPAEIHDHHQDVSNITGFRLARRLLEGHPHHACPVLYEVIRELANASRNGETSTVQSFFAMVDVCTV
jgi:hypothetical protein